MQGIVISPLGGNCSCSSQLGLCGPPLLPHLSLQSLCPRICCCRSSSCSIYVYMFFADTRPSASPFLGICSCCSQMGLRNPALQAQLGLQACVQGCGVANSAKHEKCFLLYASPSQSPTRRLCLLFFSQLGQGDPALLPQVSLHTLCPAF